MSWKEIEKELLERFGDEFSGWDRSGGPDLRPNDGRIQVTGSASVDSGHRISFNDPGHRIRVTVKSESFSAVARFLAGSGQTRFITATAVDILGASIDIWYHFDLFQAPQVLSLRISVSKSDPGVPSVASILPGAERMEREISEMFGVRFEGHPTPGRLLLPESWPRAVFPMRKG